MNPRARLRDWIVRRLRDDRRTTLARTLFTPLSSLYGFGALVRAVAYETDYLTTHRLSRPVISVGNITLGGTGKTPIVAMLARFLRDQNYDVVVLTRGYGRKGRGRQVLRSEAGELEPDAVDRCGDEPALLAREVPGVTIVVDADRVAAGRWAEQELEPDVFLLDDAFQHQRLERDVDLLVIDATDPFGGNRMPPLGRLREPLQGMRRADAVVVTRADREFDEALIERVVGGLCRENVPVYYTWHDLEELRPLDGGKSRTPYSFRSRPVALMTAIGNPAVFRADLEHTGIRVVAEMLYPDHHEYLQSDVDRALVDARAAGAEAIVTTEKDAVKLERLERSDLPFYAARIRFASDHEAFLKSLCLRAILRWESPSSGD